MVAIWNASADMPTLRILRNRLRISLRYYALRMDLLGLRNLCSPDYAFS